MRQPEFQVMPKMLDLHLYNVLYQYILNQTRP